MKGFYSPIDQLAAQLPRTKGTGAEFMTELSKRPGYKPQEAQDRELQTLMALPKMERAKFLEALKAKPPVIPNVVENDGTDNPRYLTPEERNYGGNENQTFHEQYTLPGGKNYREILLQHPQGKFKGVSEHFGGEPNILASIRVKDRLIPDLEGPHNVKVIEGNRSTNVKHKTREDAERFADIKHQGGYRTEITPLNNKKILHIEEIQSDWHQQGRDKGYLAPDTSKQLEAAKLAHLRLKEQLEDAKSSSDSYERKLKSDMPLYQDPVVRQRLQDAIVKHNNDIMDLMPQVMKAETARQELEHKTERGVPDAPFKKNWHELALKKMIHHAAANGYDSIAITPGAEQAKRYNLSQRVGSLLHDKEDSSFVVRDPIGEVIHREAGVSPERIKELVGKETADKLMQSPVNSSQYMLQGKDLEFGGSGMKGFYDKMIPSFLNQFGKKYGAQVGKIQVPVKHELQGLRTMGGYKDEPPLDLHHFPITPEMREDVTQNGVPLYAKGGEVEVRPTVKDETIQRKIPEIEAAAKALQAGAINRKEYDKVVHTHKPVKPYTFVPQPATDEDADRALMANKKPHWRGHEQWPAGRKVGLRLDIPAYETHGVWVNSIHDEEGKGEDKRKTSYGPVSSVKNASFDAGPSKAIKVATGEDNKSPFARIHGELHHMTEDEAVEHMKAHLNHPDYAQVGMDPRRHGFFYDRKTMKPVTASAHVVQIGPLVLAHKPTYGKRESYAKGGKVKPIGYTKEKVTVSPNLDQMRYELINVKHYVKKVK